jgi:hypothetical protein
LAAANRQPVVNEVIIEEARTAVAQLLPLCIDML